MQFQKSIDKTQYYFLVLFAFALPISLLLTNIFIIILSILSIIKWFNSDVFPDSNTKAIALAYLNYFFIICIGVLWVEDLSNSLFGIEKSLSLVLAPLIFLTVKIEQKSVRKLLYAFTIGSILTFFLQFLPDNIALSKNSQNAYLHLYYSIISFFYLGFIISKPKFKYGTKKVAIVLLVLLLWFLLLKLEIRNQIISTILICGFYLVYYRKKTLLIVISLATVLLVALYFSDQTFKERFDTAFDFQSDMSEMKFGGGQLRYKIWQASFEDLISKNFISGVGTRNQKDLLKNSYYKRELHIPYRDNYNLHNQYLETLFHHGILGLFSLFFIFFISIKIALENRNILHLTFLAIIAIGFITETMLARHSGIVFFTFFNIIFAKLKK